MQILLYSLASCILLVLFALCLSGRKIRRMQKEETKKLSHATVLSWPTVALIVPVCGNDPRIEESLRSLLQQEYPNYTPIFVTESAQEVAAQTIVRLKKEYPNLIHVVAGKAGLCGQKNHNHLAAIGAIRKDPPDCYVFCDSTHKAKPLFLQYLIHPIALREAQITTGYHEILPEDSKLVTLAYAASVLIMRLLQALSVFTQPWGGAMAIARDAFERLDIASLWKKTVVDDCALVSFLQKKNCPVQLVAQALVTTRVFSYSKTTWEAWMERQILFPRFCVPSQWWLLGLMLFLFFIPPLIWIEDIWISVAQEQYFALAAPLLWCGLFLALVHDLQQFLAVSLPFTSWIRAFLLALCTFFSVYLGTVGARSIVWHGKEYRVGKGGVVLEKKDLS